MGSAFSSRRSHTPHAANNTTPMMSAAQGFSPNGDSKRCDVALHLGEDLADAGPWHLQHAQFEDKVIGVGGHECSFRSAVRLSEKARHVAARSWSPAPPSGVRR